MIEKIMEGLKTTKLKLHRQNSASFENIEIELKKGNLWIKKPYEGRILVHFVNEYNSEEEVLNLLKAMEEHISVSDG